MKLLALASLLALSSATNAFAHGSLGQQATSSISKSVEIFNATQAPEVRRNFLAVSAELIGHERFAVAITMKDKVTQFKFDCTENEEVDPVIWECRAL